MTRRASDRTFIAFTEALDTLSESKFGQSDMIEVKSRGVAMIKDVESVKNMNPYFLAATFLFAIDTGNIFERDPVAQDMEMMLPYINRLMVRDDERKRLRKGMSDYAAVLIRYFMAVRYSRNTA